MRSVILTIVFALSMAGAGDAGSTPAPVRGRPGIAVRVPLLPFAWIGSRARRVFHRPLELENASALRRDQGWTVLELPVNQTARTLFIAVAGRVQFDSAEIVFGDGATRPLDLRGAVRGRGLFELHDCAAAREVATVRLHVRAATPRAYVGVRIARFDAFPAGG